MSGGAEEVLGALADERRREIVQTLAAADGLTAGEVAERLGISRQATAKHLALLTEAGLLHSRRSGRRLEHAVRPAPLRRTADWLTALADDWDRRLDTLKRTAEARSSLRSTKGRRTTTG